MRALAALEAAACGIDDAAAKPLVALRRLRTLGLARNDIALAGTVLGLVGGLPALAEVRRGGVEEVRRRGPSKNAARRGGLLERPACDER